MVDLRLRRLTMNVRSGAIYRNPPGGGGSRGHRVQGHRVQTWLSIGFFLRTIFPIEMYGNFRPFSSETARARKLKFYTLIAIAYGY